MRTQQLGFCSLGAYSSVKLSSHILINKKQWKIKNRITENIYYTHSEKSEERFLFMKLNWIDHFFGLQGAYNGMEQVQKKTGGKEVQTTLSRSFTIEGSREMGQYVERNVETRERVFNNGKPKACL